MARGVKVELPSARTRAKAATSDDPPTSSGSTIAYPDVEMRNAHEPGPGGAKDLTGDKHKMPGPTDDSPETIDSDSDAGLELLGQGMKAFVTLVQDLRELGVEELVLPLPKICVLGDQSTGKSSLIEGISGIKVPRSAGTCTRCPLEINLSTSDTASPWRCTIYLQKHFFYEGAPVLSSSSKHIKAQGATRARPLGPWQAQQIPDNILFFRTNNKADVPRALYLAQLATLNPAMDPAKFHPGKTCPDERIQVKFSPNVIRLDITAADIPNLSFYDLPGIINQAEVAEEGYLVELVANLAAKYVQNENCLNLLALPMTDDPANSTASKLVHKLNGQNRTIGVLTKPDRVQSGESMSQWIDILNEKKFKLGHGYYVVKNNPDPTVSHAVARQEEDEFFSQREPWAKSLYAHQKRFGTLKLQGILSKLLTEQIRERYVVGLRSWGDTSITPNSLPQITERVRMKTAEIIARLKELPEPPKGNLSYKILERIITLEQEVRNHLDGGSSEYPFQKEWYTAVVHFRDTIAISYPRLSLSDLIAADQGSARLPYRLSATPSPAAQRSQAIELDSDGDDVTPNYTPTPLSKRKQPVTKVSQISPSKRARLHDIPKYVPSQDSSSTIASIDRTAPYAKRFSLTEVRSILQDAHIGLPNQIDPRATKKMIEDSLSLWDKPLDELLAFTKEACLALITDRASFVFAQWHGTRFFDLLQDSCQKLFEETFAKQTTSAKQFLHKERYKALTVHEDAMRASSEKAFATLETVCRNEQAKAYLIKKNAWDEDLDPRVKEKKLKEVIDTVLGPNPYILELRALSDTRGYYECAASRLVDNVYQDIHTELFATCRDRLGDALKQRIGLEERDAEERCAILLAVDPESERVRVELNKQKENLEKASVWLASQ
ncbi:MAG: hypothetical protein LQ352_001986 [Teloschistes flavicans]|nr:MAG: hypothetical protein LQ352_001986 [Teloschistes flavicans]